MARIRTIKPEFWRHEALCELPEATHMLAAALLNYADDFGYFNANPKLIIGEIYPLREPSVSVPESLRSLHAIGYILVGHDDRGRQYGRIVEFEKHQKVSHPTDSKISDLSITWDDSGIIPENIVRPPETFRPEQGTRNREQGKELLPADAGPSDPISSTPKKISYPEDFEQFWKTYPTDPNMPKKPTLRQWQRLSPEKRLAAIAAIPGFRRYCDENKSWYRPIYAERFLSQEKFEGFGADGGGATIHVLSPEIVEQEQKNLKRLGVI